MEFSYHCISYDANHKIFIFITFRWEFMKRYEPNWCNFNPAHISPLVTGNLLQADFMNTSLWVIYASRSSLHSLMDVNCTIQLLWELQFQINWKFMEKLPVVVQTCPCKCWSCVPVNLQIRYSNFHFSPIFIKFCSRKSLSDTWSTTKSICNLHERFSSWVISHSQLSALCGYTEILQMLQRWTREQERERERTMPVRFCSSANEPWKDHSSRKCTRIHEHDTRIHEQFTRIHE